MYRKPHFIRGQEAIHSDPVRIPVGPAVLYENHDLKDVCKSHKKKPP